VSETILKILLDELQTVRLRCTRGDCGVVTEVRLDQVGDVTACPRCRTDWRDAKLQHLGVFHGLADAFRVARGLTQASVEFVLVQKPAEGGAR
jgi:hypothetical protein